MTNAEAAKLVEHAFNMYESECYMGGDDWSKEHEARDMAIKALDQEPCEDAVSREAILLQIGKIKDNYGGLLDVARFIRKLPSVQPKQNIGHWKYYYSPFQRVSAFSDTKAQCDKCGYTKNRYDGEILNYCPNCGSKMEG